MQKYKNYNLEKRADGYVYYTRRGNYSGKDMGQPIGRTWASFKAARKCVDIILKKAKVK